MEREFEPESLNVIPVSQPASPELPWEDSSSRLPVALLAVLMLLPWVWVYLGLEVIQDYRFTICMYELLGCAVPVVIFGGHRLPFWPLRCNVLWLAGVAGILGTMIVLVYKASNGFGMDWPFFLSRATQSKLAVNDSFWLFALVIGVINPVLEEAFWRGLIYRGWKARLGEAKARWLSSFFFGAWHWLVLSHFCNPVWAVVLTLLVMVGGVLFCMLYERTKSLGAAVLFHGLGADFPMIFVVYDSVMNHIK
jgi:membrane protease YdiL (CAAX protease family)